MTFARVFFILVLAASSAACTRDVSNRGHSAPVGVEDPTQRQSGQSSAPTVPLSEKLSGDAQSLASQAEALLSPKTLSESGRKLLEINTARELHALGSRVVQLLDSAAAKGETASSDESVKNLLATYKTAMMQGCDGYLKGCLYVGFFQKSPSSARIAREIAETEESVEGRYRLLRFAYAVKNSTQDPVLDAAYLRESKPYFDALAKRTDQNARSLQIEHVEVTTNLLNRLETQSNVQVAAQIMPQIMQQYRPWDFSETRSPQLARVYESLLTLAAKRDLYSTGNALSPEFSKRVGELAARADGLMSRLQAAKKRTPTALKALGLPEAVRSSEYFFIFENLFEGRISANDASNIWFGTLQDVARARQELETYSRLRFVLLSLEGNAIMQDFFNSEGRFTADSLLDEGFRESEIVVVKWKDGLRRLQQLSLFFDRHLSDTSEDAKRLKLFYSDAHRNVKYVSTYPTMLMASYHLSRVQFSRTVMTWTGPVEFDAAQILNWYFAGKFAPWYEFSQDRTTLSKSEITQAFMGALKIGMFEGSGVSYTDFFKIAAAQALDSDAAKIRKWMDEFKRRYDNSADYQEFLRLCSQREKSRLAPMNQAPITEFESRTYQGYPLGIAHTSLLTPSLETAWALYENDRVFNMREKRKGEDASVPRDMDETVEFVRMDYSPKLEQVLSLVSLVETHLKETQSPVDAERMIREIREAIAPFEALRSEFYTRLLSLHRQAGTCIDWMFDEEFTSEEFVLMAYMQRLREVHAAMTQLGRSSDSSFRQDFNFAGKAGFTFPGLEEHERGLGYTKDAFRFSKVQVYLFFKSALENGAKTERGSEPPRRAVGTYTLPSNIRHIETGIRSVLTEVPYRENVDEFIALAMKDMFSMSKNYVARWADLSGLPSRLIPKVRLMAALYKAGEIKVLECKGKDKDCNQTSTIRVSADDVIKASLSVARRFELSDGWAKILPYTGYRWRFINTDISLEDYAFRKSDRSWLGMLDYPFSLILKEVLGDAPADGETQGSESGMNTRVGKLEEARRYLLSKRSSGNSLVASTAQTSAQLDRLYLEPASLEFKLQADFVRAAIALDKEATSKPGFYPAWRMTVDRKRVPSAPMLSHNIIQDLKSRAEMFTKDTGHQISDDIFKW